MKAKKRFGQHFLHDQNIINKIMRALNPGTNQHWVEIGPGRGALTCDLLALTKELDVIELDRDLIPMLEQQCGQYGNLKIYNADALRFDFASLQPQPLRVFGNLPYNISTPLLFHLLDYISMIKDMHFMLQKEVAERLAAVPGTHAYGQLTVLVQYFCQVQLLFHIAPGAFNPPPKVESAFIRLVPRQPDLAAHDLVKFRQIVKQAFNQRRKMLRKSLVGVMSANQLEALAIDPTRRPEELTVIEFVKISNSLP